MIIDVCQCNSCRLVAGQYPIPDKAFPGLPWIVGPHGHLCVAKRVLLRLHDDKVRTPDGEPSASVCILGQRTSSSFVGDTVLRTLRDIKGLAESQMERYS